MSIKKIKRIESGPRTSELRQDPVSGDWILLAPSRALRPEFFAVARKEKQLSLKKCPFENPQKFGNEAPSLVFQKPEGNDWFLQVIKNKFSAVGPGRCGVIDKVGPHLTQDGTGRHEVMILRDHSRFLADLTVGELKKLLEAYIDRLKFLSDLPCTQYISIFHNHGREAGASILHPHSQALALPVVPPDVGRSLKGSYEYFRKNKKCVHCAMIAFEKVRGQRLIYENKKVVAFAPFASRNDFEIRIFPKNHEAYFEKADSESLAFLAQAFKAVLSKLKRGLKDPSFNLFLHTAPVSKEKARFKHYHWHFEVLPKLKTLGGFELGTGIDIITMAPEMAAEFLREVKV